MSPDVPAPLVSFVVPTVNRPAELARFLASADRQACEDYEILVIDQSAEPVPVDRHRHTRRFESRTRGLSHCRNIGLRHATGRLVVFADDDCVLSDDYVATLETLAGRIADPLVFGFCSALNLEDDRPFVPTFRPGMSTATAWNCDTLCSISLVFDRAVFDRVGAFDEDFGMGARHPAAEETDLLLRIFEAGGRGVSLVPLTIRHPRRSRAPELVERYQEFGRAHGALARKHARNLVYLTRFGYGLLRTAGGAAIAAIRRDGLLPVYVASLRGRLRGLRSAP